MIDIVGPEPVPVAGLAPNILCAFGLIFCFYSIQAVGVREAALFCK